MLKDELYLYEGEEPTDDECRKVLCQDGETYTDEEIKLIKTLLLDWGEIFSDQLVDTVQQINASKNPVNSKT